MRLRDDDDAHQVASVDASVEDCDRRVTSVSMNLVGIEYRSRDIAVPASQLRVYCKVVRSSPFRQEDLPRNARILRPYVNYGRMKFSNNCERVVFHSAPFRDKRRAARSRAAPVTYQPDEG